MSPVIHENRLYISSLSSQLNVLNAQTGRLLQTVPLTPSRSPIITKGGILIGTLDGELVFLNRGLKRFSHAKYQISQFHQLKAGKTILLLQQLVRLFIS